MKYRQFIAMQYAQNSSVRNIFQVSALRNRAYGAGNKELSNCKRFAESASQTFEIASAAHSLSVARHRCPSFEA